MTTGRDATRHVVAGWIAPLLVMLLAWMTIDGHAAETSGEQFLTRFVEEARAAGLPTGFVQAIPPTFLDVEFDDLHAFAAEYHPDEHQMVLNQSLSFNSAGGMLKPVSQLAPRDLGTIYHELFHAYLDYLLSLSDPASANPRANRLLTLAQKFRECRYQAVTITPILQRPHQTEVRFLTDGESWEALHETWAVFVGWSIWTHVDLQRRHAGTSVGQTAKAVRDGFADRLQQADREGELKGYYEPEQEAERAITRKRFLAPSHRITPSEIQALLEDVLEYDHQEASKTAGLLNHDRSILPGAVPCPSIS